MAQRVILITGANRGIGLAILQGLAQRSPSDQFLLGCRNPADGEAAVKRLRSLGIQSNIDVIQLDVTSDESLRATVENVRDKYHKLDILINNAGISRPYKPDLSDLREVYNTIYNTNVTSVALAMSLFLPLLRETSSDPRIINVSSTTGSFGLAPKFPVLNAEHAPYIITKSALNMLTVGYAKLKGNQNVTFQSAGPGLCRTDLNDAARTVPTARDPLDGARVFVELALAEKGKYPNGFWYMADEDKEAQPVPW